MADKSFTDFSNLGTGAGFNPMGRRYALCNRSATRRVASERGCVVVRREAAAPVPDSLGGSSPRSLPPPGAGGFMGGREMPGGGNARGGGPPGGGGGRSGAPGGGGPGGGGGWRSDNVVSERGKGPGERDWGSARSDTR